jgi:hypothetical protein
VAIGRRQRRLWRAWLSLLAALVCTLGFATATAVADAPLSWSAPSAVDPPHNAVEAIACPSASLCVAADEMGNVLTSTDPTGGGATWSTEKVDDGEPDAISGIACPSSTLCVATDLDGNVLTATDPTGGKAAWAVTDVDETNDLNDVSCPSAELCVAVDRLGNAVTSTDPAGGASAWTPAKIDTGNDLDGISCPSVSLCVATDVEGNVVSSTDPTGGGAAWTVTNVTGIPNGENQLNAISCPSVSLCVAAGGSGDIATSTDPAGGALAWTIANIDAQTQLSAVSCTASLLCVVTDPERLVATTTTPAGGAGAWTLTTVDSDGDDTMYAVSCQAESLCVVGATSHVLVGTLESISPPSGASGSAPTGTLAISPATVYSTASVQCGGVSWPAGSVATQWLLDGAPIAGATSTTFVPPRSEDGHQLACRQTATGEGGVSNTLTSASRTVYELAPQPSWANSADTTHCGPLVCIYDPVGGQVTETYSHAGDWWAASPVECQSAPWTSAAGDSVIPEFRDLAEAHTVGITLERMTATGPLILASEQVSNLGVPRDLAFYLSANPLNVIMVGYGSQPFMAGEASIAGDPQAVGKPDTVAAGQGIFVYYVPPGGGGEARSFYLSYHLTAADLGGRLRCIASAEDGPLATPTAASYTSDEVKVSSSPGCAPQEMLAGDEPQPALVTYGAEDHCVSAPIMKPPEKIGVGKVPVIGGVADIALNCTLPGGCDGTLALIGKAATGASAARAHRSRTVVLARVRFAASRGQRRVARLKLNSHARLLLRRAGHNGLSATLRLTSHRHNHTLATLQLESAHK